MKIKPYFKWFDFWIGFFYDIKKKILYIGILPMLGIKISFYKELPPLQTEKITKSTNDVLLKKEQERTVKGNLFCW